LKRYGVTSFLVHGYVKRTYIFPIIFPPLVVRKSIQYSIQSRSKAMFYKYSVSNYIRLLGETHSLTATKHGPKPYPITWIHPRTLTYSFTFHQPKRMRKNSDDGRFRWCSHRFKRGDLSFFVPPLEFHSRGFFYSDISRVLNTVRSISCSFSTRPYFARRFRRLFFARRRLYTAVTHTRRLPNR